jgi:hypothetical protein
VLRFGFESFFFAFRYVHLHCTQAMWMFVGAGLSFVGVIHSFSIEDNIISPCFGFPAHCNDDPNWWSLQYSISYSLVGVSLLLFQLLKEDSGLPSFIHKCTDRRGEVRHSPNTDKMQLTPKTAFLTTVHAKEIPRKRRGGGGEGVTATMSINPKACAHANRCHSLPCH